MRGLATIAAVVLVAGSLAAQEPATGIAEPEAVPAGAEGMSSGPKQTEPATGIAEPESAPAGAEGTSSGPQQTEPATGIAEPEAAQTSSDARQIIEVHTPPRDVLRDTVLVVLGGVITGVVGLIAGWLLFRHERKARRRTIAAVLVAELNHILATVDTSLAVSVNPETAIANLRLLENRDRVYKAVLPQIGELGVQNANEVIALYYGLELLVTETNSIDLMRATVVGRSQISACIEHAKNLRDETRKLYRSLIRQFLRSEKVTKVRGAVDGDRPAGPSS